MKQTEVFDLKPHQQLTKGKNFAPKSMIASITEYRTRMAGFKNHTHKDLPVPEQCEAKDCKWRSWDIERLVEGSIKHHIAESLKKRGL